VRLKGFFVTILLLLSFAARVEAYTANKVFFEFRKNGTFRIYVNYTVPELKEYRSAYVTFDNKKAAEKFYFDLLRGADFHPRKPADRTFVSPVLEPAPW
jgi:hypothetical protein